jgi:hypothetical protein
MGPDRQLASKGNLRLGRHMTVGELQREASRLCIDSHQLGHENTFVTGHGHVDMSITFCCCGYNPPMFRQCRSGIVDLPGRYGQ